MQIVPASSTSIEQLRGKGINKSKSNSSKRFDTALNESKSNQALVKKSKTNNEPKLPNSKPNNQLPESETPVSENLLFNLAVEPLLTRFTTEPTLTEFSEEIFIDLPPELQLELEEMIKEMSLLGLVSNEQSSLQNPVQFGELVKVFSQIINGNNQQLVAMQENMVVKLQRFFEKLATTKGSANKEDVQLNFQGQKDSMGSTNKEDVQLNFLGQKESLNREEMIQAVLTRNVPKESSSSQVVLPNVHGLPLNQIQQFVMHVGEARVGQQNEEQLLRQFQNILEKSTLMQFPNGLNKLSIKLFPQHLGRLDVTLTQQNGVIIAQLMTTTKAAKNVLESQLHQLRHAFVSQNIQVEKIEIFTQQQQQTLQQSDRQNHENNNANQQNKPHKEQDERNKEEVTFQELLNETFDVEV